MHGMEVDIVYSENERLRSAIRACGTEGSDEIKDTKTELTARMCYARGGIWYLLRRTQD